MPTVGSIINGAFRLVREHPGAVLIWMLIYLATTVVGLFVTQPSLEMEAAAAGGADPLAMPGFWSAFGSMMLVQIASSLVFMILFTAALRAILRPQEPGSGFLRLGADELRIIGLAIFLTIILYGGMLVMILFLFTIAALVMGPAAIGGVWFVLLLALPVVFVAVWLYVRFSLAFPLTVLRRKIVIGESWELTRGRFWTLFGAYLVLILILVLLSIAGSVMTASDYWSDIIGSGFDAEVMAQAARRQLERMNEFDPLTLLGLVLGGAIGGLTIAFLGGASATAARELAGDVTLASEFA